MSKRAQGLELIMWRPRRGCAPSGLGDVHLQFPAEVVREHSREREDFVGRAAAAGDVVETGELRLSCSFSGSIMGWHAQGVHESRRNTEKSGCPVVLVGH